MDNLDLSETLVRLINDTFVTDEAAVRWWNSPSPDLQGETPATVHAGRGEEPVIGALLSFDSYI
jgi:hypothetical protein